jgi:hypothetical protein
MNAFLDKLKRVESEIAQEKGGIALFGLFEREQGLQRWDVVIAAPWTAEGLRKSIDYVFSKLSDHLTFREFLDIARVVPLLPTVPFVKAVHEMVGQVDGPKEITAFTFEGMEVKRGYILSSYPASQTGSRHFEAAAS